MKHVNSSNIVTSFIILDIYSGNKKFVAYSMLIGLEVKR